MTTSGPANTFDAHGRGHDKGGLFAAAPPNTEAPASTLVLDRDHGYDTVLTSFIDGDTNQRVDIVRVDEETFEARGVDGAVTFTANAHSTLDELAAEGSDFWADDDLGERGLGLESLYSEERNAYVSGYIEAALFAGVQDENGDEIDGLDADDFTPEALASFRQDLDDFMKANRGLIDQAMANSHYNEYNQVGADFFFTRCGHGVGFWDRGLGDIGQQLSDAAKVYGGSDIYVGDDGKLHV